MKSALAVTPAVEPELADSHAHAFAQYERRRDSARSRPTMQHTLDYLRQSPVRGQLEPPDANTLPGWRYIQTTDTPNEFKAFQFLSYYFTY